MNKSAEQILRKLISFHSTTDDPEGMHEAIEYIDRFLSERGMHVKRFEFNGFESLVATTMRTKTPKVMLYGHIDVVPAEDELFSMQHRDGKLIGRGMMDMKAAVAAYLQIVDELQDRLHEYDFGLMIVSDEEVGGQNGTVPLIQEGYLPEVCVMPDGGRDWAMETFAKGLWLFDVKVEGKSAHGSRPWEGDSAIDKLMHLLQELKLLFPAQQGWDTSTCTIGKLNGGEVINQVSAWAVASLDMRFASVEDEKNIMNGFKLLCEAHNATITNEVYSAPCINDPENPYLQQFAASLEKAVGYPTGTTTSNAGSDGRFFAAKGIPCAIFYPTGGGHHGPEEWVPEEAYAQLQLVFRDYLDKVARVQGAQVKSSHVAVKDTIVS